MAEAEEVIDQEEKWREFAVLAMVPAFILALILISWGLAHWHIGPVALNAAIAIVAVLFGGFPRFVSGLKDAFNCKITVNVFVIVALTVTVAAGEFRPAAIIIFIMAVVGALESYTLDKTRRAIRDLLNLTPPTATVRRGNSEISIALADLQVGDIVVVRPGERIPVDGVVTEGAGTVNQAPITGESIPVEKFKGSEVFAGTLNETGRLNVQTVKTGENTTLAKIVHLVEEARETKAPIQTMADRFTVWFFPTVIALAIIAFLTSGDIKVAVSVLLVACPCAFAIATPSAVSAGIANMARRGVLIKGGIFFELAGKIDVLLVDKTGTLTFGRTKVVEVLGDDGVTPDRVLRLAAIAEKYSEHPLARAVLASAREKAIELPDPEEFKIEVGMGVTAHYNGECIVVGNSEFLRSRGFSIPPRLGEEIDRQTAQGRTVILVGHARMVVGLLAIADEVRPETALALMSLKDLGVREIAMLTGDNPLVAEAVAKQVGVSNFRAGLLPKDKQEVVKEFKAKGCRVAMVGDGINDAPALALADVGIAMGAAGTHVAIEAADVTLMNDDLGRVAEFIGMSHKVLRRIKLNIFFSIIYNVIGLVLGTIGLLTPVVAVIFQEAGCVSVVLSSTLLLWAKTNKTVIRR